MNELLKQCAVCQEPFQPHLQLVGRRKYCSPRCRSNKPRPPRPETAHFNLDRLMKHVVPVPESGCWLWDGYWSTKGYGITTLKNNPYYAHRVMYESLRGPVPKDMELDHLCRVKCCVNPDHLEAVTSRENTLRGTAPSAMHARQTHCIHGHPLAADNMAYWEVGTRKRHCKECNKLRHIKRAAQTRQRRIEREKPAYFRPPFKKKQNNPTTLTAGGDGE